MCTKSPIRFFSSNQVSVWIHVVPRQNLVVTVLDVKLRVWKTVGVSSVFALKAEQETAVRSPKIAQLMQALQTPRRVSIQYTHRTIQLTAPFVTLTSGLR